MKRMSKQLRFGGVQFVGEFYAQTVINIATKVGAILDHCHAKSVRVSTSTHTFAQLKKVYGVATPAHAREVVPFVSHQLKIPQQVCENMMCEEVRHKYSGVCNVKDIYFDGDSLFELEGTDVLKVTVRGTRRKQNFKKTEFNTSYRPEIQWWDRSLHFGRGTSHPWDSIIFVHKTMNTQLNKGSKRMKRS